MDLKNLLPRGIRPEPKIEAAKRTIPKAAWEQPEMITCKACQRRATRANWNRSLQVCPNCGYHAPIGGYYRLSLVLDHGSFCELDADVQGTDPLQFPDYAQKAAAQTRATGMKEAAVTAKGTIGGMPVVAAVLDSQFLMGSMGTAVGISAC